MAGKGRRNADDSLALAVAGGRTLRDAAADVGIGERTAARRWADTAFRRRVTTLRGEMMARALGKIADGMADAADVRRKLLKAKSENVRLAACRAILELGTKLRDSVDVEERLQALEREHDETTLRQAG